MKFDTNDRIVSHVNQARLEWSKRFPFSTSSSNSNKTTKTEWESRGVVIRQSCLWNQNFTSSHAVSSVVHLTWGFRLATAIVNSLAVISLKFSHSISSLSPPPCTHHRWVSSLFLIHIFMRPLLTPKKERSLNVVIFYSRWWRSGRRRQFEKMSCDFFYI